MKSPTLPVTNPLLRFRSYAWWLVVLAALGFLIWENNIRINRVDYLSGLPGWSAAAPALDSQSATGYVDGQRKLIVAGHHNASYPWIIETQQMLAQGTWRIRHVDYDNAPLGRKTRATSPYRWWLALVAWIDHFFSGRSIGLAVEHAALYADPVLHAILVISVALFAARYFGKMSALFGAVALVALFPLAGAFQAGAPDNHALTWLCVMWSVLPLLAGLNKDNSTKTPPSEPGRSPNPARHLFIMGGIAGGIGLWTDVVGEWPIVAGIFLGALFVVFAPRSEKSATESIALPWRAWAIAGAATSMVAYLIEYFPADLDWHVQSIHPLHAIAWLGLGELLVRLTEYRRREKAFWNGRSFSLVLISIAGVAALPVVILSTKIGWFMADDLFAAQLANVPSATMAKNLAAWIGRDGMTAAVFAVWLPAVVSVAALGWIMTRKISSVHRSLLALSLGPAVMSLGFACAQLRWWNTFDLTSVGIIIVIVKVGGDFLTATTSRIVAASLLALLMIPGVLLVLPRPGSRAGDPLSRTEAQAMVERDLAYWLVRQSGSNHPVIFSTPSVTETLIFFGGVKGLATYDTENNDGFNAAVRIACAASWPEAQALLNSRETTHLIFPAWDPTFEQLVRLGRRVDEKTALPANTLIGYLQNWNLPPWLRVLSYHLPKNSGFEDLGVTVFGIHGEQDEALGVCRLADYFVEMEMVDQVRAAREQLLLYPRNLAALIALAHVDQVLGNTDEFQKIVATLLPYLTRRSARTLPFDRRLSLAALLVQAKQMETAREQMQLSDQDLSAVKIRELTTGALVQLLALNQLFGLELPDPQLKQLALSLLPPALRARLEENNAAHG